MMESIKINIFLLNEGLESFSGEGVLEDSERFFINMENKETLADYFEKSKFIVDYHSRGGLVIELCGKEIFDVGNHICMLSTLWNALISIKEFLLNGYADISLIDLPADFHIKQLGGGFMEVKLIYFMKEVQGTWKVERKEFVNKLISAFELFYMGIEGHSTHTFAEEINYIKDIRKMLY